MQQWQYLLAITWHPYHSCMQGRIVIESRFTSNPATNNERIYAWYMHALSSLATMTFL